jgi:hypothetical protein
MEIHKILELGGIALYNSRLFYPIPVLTRVENNEIIDNKFVLTDKLAFKLRLRFYLASVLIPNKDSMVCKYIYRS